MVILGLAAVIAKQHNPLVKVFIIGDHHSTVADPAQVLTRKKAETSQRSETAGFSVPYAAGDRLGRVLDDMQVMEFGDFHDRLHVSHLTEEVYRQYRPCLGGHCLFYQLGIDVVRLRVDID